MKTTHVLFLHKWFSLSGGVERVHKNLSVALLEQGVHSSFYVNDTSGNKREGFERLCTEFTAVAAPQALGFRGKLKHLYGHIEREQVTVLIAATETANLLAWLCALKYRHLKVIYTRHCAFDVSDQKLAPWMIKLLYNLYALTNQTIVTVSEGLKNELARVVKFGKAGIKFIPNAVISANIQQLSEKNSDDFGLHNYFCAVGRLVEQKGFDLLLRAYAQANAKSPDLPLLVIVGEGKDEQMLKQLAVTLEITDKVIFTGFTDNPYYIIKQAEAFVLSSRHEGMPTVLIEAMHLNTPVIAFDCPTGPSELIESGVNGYLVPAEDVDKLADAMLRYQHLQSRSIAPSVAKFQFQQVAQAYMDQF